MVDGPTNGALLRMIADLDARVKALESKRPAKSAQAVEDEMFDAFWAVYPKRVGKGAAKKAWSKVPVPIRCTALSAATEYGHVYDKATEEQIRFVPNPATWLNACGWEDDPKVWRANLMSHAPVRKAGAQLPLIGHGTVTVLSREQEEALAKAQEDRRKADRAELVKRLKAQGKLPKGYVDGDEGGPF